MLRPFWPPTLVVLVVLGSTVALRPAVARPLPPPRSMLRMSALPRPWAQDPFGLRLTLGQPRSPFEAALGADLGQVAAGMAASRAPGPAQRTAASPPILGWEWPLSLALGMALSADAGGQGLALEKVLPAVKRWHERQRWLFGAWILPRFHHGIGLNLVWFF
jgi:hypothetical protein